MPKNISIHLRPLSRSSYPFAADSTRIKLIPEPVSLKELRGSFTLNNTVGLEVADTDKKLEGTAQWFADQLTFFFFCRTRARVHAGGGHNPSPVSS